MISGDRWKKQATTSTSEECGYEVVRPEAVPDVVPLAVWLAAERTLLHCARDLGLPPSIQIMWIRETHMAVVKMEQTLEHLAHLAGDHHAEAQAFIDVPKVQGMARSFHEKEIRVRVDLSITETVRTVAHELRHLADFAKYRPPRTAVEYATLEAHARAYEDRMVLALGYV